MISSFFLKFEEVGIGRNGLKKRDIKRDLKKRAEEGARVPSCYKVAPSCTRGQHSSI